MFNSEEEKVQFAVLIAQAVSKEISKHAHSGCNMCLDSEFAKTHRDQHVILGEWIEYLKQISKLKWGVGTFVLGMLTLTGLIFLVFKVTGINIKEFMGG